MFLFRRFPSVETLRLGIFCLMVALAGTACQSRQPSRANFSSRDFTSQQVHARPNPQLPPRKFQPVTQGKTIPLSAGPAQLAPNGVNLGRAESVLLIDANTGRTLAARNAEQTRAVASTQKLLTALVVRDAGQLDKPVVIQASDINVEPTRSGIRVGEVYTRRQLLNALLVKSGNDTAMALARDVSGSIAAFSARMNAKARSLGALRSNFLNPHGLTQPGQYSNARDMSRIAMAAYRDPVLRGIMSQKNYRLACATSSRTLKNTNDLLGRMPHCDGMKTGYTNAAGRCLISSARLGQRAVILVQLGTRTKYIWDDGEQLMSWGLHQ